MDKAAVYPVASVMDSFGGPFSASLTILFHSNLIRALFLKTVSPSSIFKTVFVIITSILSVFSSDPKCSGAVPS